MRTFSTYSAFKAHFYRVHNVFVSSDATRAVVKDLKYVISTCKCQFQTLKELVSHLKEHIVEGGLGAEYLQLLCHLCSEKHHYVQ